MVMLCGQRRRLKDDAMPTLHVPNIAIDNVNIGSADIDIAALQTSPNVACNSVLVPGIPREVSMESPQIIRISTNRTANVSQLRKKNRQYQKNLHKKRKTIIKNRQKMKNIMETNTWDTATAEMTGVKKTFIEIIIQNFHRAPQVC